MSFLNPHVFSNDPFASIQDTDHPYSEPQHLHWVCISANWFTCLKDRSSIIVADSIADGIAWALNIPGQYLISGTFAIADIAKASPSNFSSDDVLLSTLCRVAAERWLDLIVGNPYALLAQSADNIDMLFDLLVWHCLDVELLLRRLGVFAEPPDLGVDEQEVKQLVETYISQRAAERLRIADPTRLQQIKWLSIRPPGLDEQTDATVILVLLHSSISVSGENDVGLLAQQLKKNRIYFHLVGERSTMEHFRSLHTETLSWTNDEIQAMIDARIAAASAPNGPRTFADLTDYLSLGDINPYTYLWDAAQGSLHRALKYCRVAVEIHQNSGALGGFTEETLRSARDAVNREKF